MYCSIVYIKTKCCWKVLNSKYLQIGNSLQAWLFIHTMNIVQWFKKWDPNTKISSTYVKSKSKSQNNFYGNNHKGDDDHDNVIYVS